MKDMCLTDPRVFERIHEENARQLLKWGVQDRTPFEWLTYLMEEVGELAQAISEYEYRAGFASDVVDEAVQVATLACKVAEMYAAAVAREEAAEQSQTHGTIEEIRRTRMPEIERSHDGTTQPSPENATAEGIMP